MNLNYLTPQVLKAIARRLIIPVIVLIVVGGAVVHYSSEIEAQNQQKLIEIGSLEWEIEELDERIGELKDEIAVVQAQGERYETIVANGFLTEQSRLRAAQLLEELGPKYGLVFLGYDFQPEMVEEIKGEDGTELLLTRTEIGLEVRSLTDTQILGFIAEFISRLDGQVQVDAMNVRRISEISDALLDQIVAGERVAVFEGTLSINWNNAVVVAGNDDDDDDWDDDDWDES
ncbi:MAG: hypothetical protein AAF563_02560 [Pseudomonadota bacterium]